MLNLYVNAKKYKFASKWMSLEMKENLSDEIIIKGINSHDYGVFKFLFNKYFTPMTLFAEYYMYDVGEAKDIVQDVFEYIWTNESSFKDVKNINAYLFTLVKNKCLNRIKHLNIEDKYSQRLAEAQLHAEIPDVELDSEVVQIIRKTIDKLPEKEKKIFIACVYENKKYKEIASELGISVNTVNTNMTRAYKFLKENLNIVTD